MSFPEGWRLGPLISLSGEIVNVTHIVRISPMVGGSAAIHFVDGKSMKASEAFTQVVSMVSHALIPTPTPGAPHDRE